MNKCVHVVYVCGIFPVKLSVLQKKNTHKLLLHSEGFEAVLLFDILNALNLLSFFLTQEELKAARDKHPDLQRALFYERKNK